MTRTCCPFVRYTLNTPVPPADRPRLKKRACTEKRDESGNSLIAKGSSKDSSTSRGVKELSHSKGVLFQSNSIVWLIVNQTPMQCNDNVITSGVPGCQRNIYGQIKQNGHRNCSVANSQPANARLLLALLAGGRITELVNETNQRQEQGNHDAADHDREEHNHNWLQERSHR